MAVTLTDAQIDYIVDVISFVFEGDLRQTKNDSVYGDPVILPGQGVSDYDKVLTFMDTYPLGIFKVDLGTSSSQEMSGMDSQVWRQVSRDDVVALRAAFIEKWGDVDKVPNPIPPGSGHRLTDPVLN